MLIITAKKNKSSPTISALFFTLCLLIVAALILALTVAAGATLPWSRSRETGAAAGEYPLIIIDAGHGGEDGGAVGTGGVLEKDLNLDIALTLYDMLRLNSVPVLLTRSEDILLYDKNSDYQGRKKVLDLQNRLKISNDNPGAIFLSIHMNAFPQKKYSGLQVYYSMYDPDSKILANILQGNVKSLLQPDNLRKSKAANSNIYLLHKNQNSAVLIECGFLSNDEECALLSREEYRRQMALTIFASIMEYLESAGEDSSG